MAEIDLTEEGKAGRQELERFLEWTDSGFQVVFIFESRRPIVNLFRESLEAKAQTTNVSFLANQSSSDPEVVFLKERLLKPPEERTWLVFEQIGQQDQDETARKNALKLLNERRDLFREKINGILFIVLPDDYSYEAMGYAPDLWSIRAKVIFSKTWYRVRVPVKNFSRDEEARSSEEAEAVLEKWLASVKRRKKPDPQLNRRLLELLASGSLPLEDKTLIHEFENQVRNWPKNQADFELIRLFGRLLEFHKFLGRSDFLKTFKKKGYEGVFCRLLRGFDETRQKQVFPAFFALTASALQKNEYFNEAIEFMERHWFPFLEQSGLKIPVAAKIQRATSYAEIGDPQRALEVLNVVDEEISDGYMQAMYELTKSMFLFKLGNFDEPLKRLKERVFSVLLEIKDFDSLLFLSTHTSRLLFQEGLVRVAEDILDQYVRPLLRKVKDGPDKMEALELELDILEANHGADAAVTFIRERLFPYINGTSPTVAKNYLRRKVASIFKKRGLPGDLEEANRLEALIDTQTDEDYLGVDL